MFTHEETLHLVERWQKHRDRAARDALVENYTRLIHKLAQAHRNWAPYDDLVSEGYVGLCLAINRFDASRGVKLSTLIGVYARGFMLNLVERGTGVMRAGATKKERLLFWRMGRTRHFLFALGEEDTSEAIGRVLGLDEQFVAKTIAAFRHYSIEAGAHGNRPFGLKDSLADPGPDAEEQLVEAGEHAQRKAVVERAMKKLDPRERHVITARFFSEDKVTLQELGDAFGLSRERMRQLEARALSKLRSALSHGGFPCVS